MGVFSNQCGIWISILRWWCWTWFCYFCSVFNVVYIWCFNYSFCTLFDLYKRKNWDKLESCVKTAQCSTTKIDETIGWWNPQTTQHVELDFDRTHFENVDWLDVKLLEFVCLEQNQLYMHKTIRSIAHTMTLTLSLSYVCKT